MQGVFITIEGVEGSGKSTQLLRLSERLRRLGLPVVVPYSPPSILTNRAMASGSPTAASASVAALS